MKIKTLRSFYEQSAISNDNEDLEIKHFNLVDVENLFVPSKVKPDYSRRSYYKISYVAGKSKIHYINKTFAIDGPALVFTNPILPYDWEINDEPQTGYVCIFTANYLADFIDLQQCILFASAANSVIALSGPTQLLIKDIFLRIRQELGGDYPLKHDLIRHMLSEIIHYAQKEQAPLAATANQHPPYERIYLHFSTLLNEQFKYEAVQNNTVNKSPSFFAREIGLHINHLNKALQAVTGQSTTALIQKRILDEAIYLLKSTTLSVKEIAWKLGFAQANHFAVFFKRNTSQAPHVFRKAGND